MKLTTTNRLNISGRKHRHVMITRMTPVHAHIEDGVLYVRGTGRRTVLPTGSEYPSTFEFEIPLETLQVLVNEGKANAGARVPDFHDYSRDLNNSLTRITPPKPMNTTPLTKRK